MTRFFFINTKACVGFLALLYSLFAISCTEIPETVSCFPNQIISVQLNLNLPQYSDLNYTGGAAYVNTTGSGNNGLIVVRTSSGFKCYDRNAPHICPDNNTQLNILDNIKLICPKDGAEWILSTGEPIKISQISPKVYPTQHNSSTNVLQIFN